MKKVFLMLTIAACTASFVACNGKKSETNEGNQDSTKVETTAPADSAATASSSEGDLISQYSDLVDKAIALYPKVKSGDVTAVQEYTKLSQQISDVAVKLQGDAQKLTPEQTTKLTEISKKFADIATAK